MKILVLSDFFATGGGAGAIAEALATALAKLHEVRVLTAHAPKNFALDRFKLTVSALDYPRVWRNYLGIYHPKAIGVLRRYLEEYCPDIALVHAFHTNWSYASLKVLNEFKIKFIITFHDVSAFTPYVKLCRVKPGQYRYSWLRHLRDAKLTFNPWRNTAIRKYLGYATKTVAVSFELKKALEQNGIKVAHVVHNGVDIPKRGSLPIYGPFGLAQGRPINRQTTHSEHTIFFGGRLSTSKGTLHAVQYLQILKNKYHILPTLIVAGSAGPATAKMREQAKALGVLAQIRFLGWLQKGDYERALRAASVVIVPSICFDSFPTIILEAMKFAKPVVATNLGGAKELVVDQVTGFIEDPKDVKEFSDRIAKILSNAQKAEAMGSAGYERVRTSFTVEKMVREYLSLI